MVNLKQTKQDFAPEAEGPPQPVHRETTLSKALQQLQSRSKHVTALKLLKFSYTSLILVFSLAALPAQIAETAQLGSFCQSGQAVQLDEI